MAPKSASIPETHFLRNQADPSLESTHVSGPIAFLNPTRVHFRPAPKSKERQEEEELQQQAGAVTTTGKQPSVEYLWRARDNRKGRHALHVKYAPEQHGPGHVLPESTARPQYVLRILVRMVTYFPYWDVSYLVAAIFTLGSVVWVVNSFFAWLPLVDPSTTFSGESTIGGGVSGFIGATIFEIGSVLLLLEAVNENHASCFGWAVENVVKRLESREDLINTTEVRPLESHDCSHHHSNKGSFLRDGLRERSTDDQRSFEWLPSLSELRSHYFHELGFLASFVQLIGATIFWIAGFTGLPGILNHMSQGLTDGVYWTPQIVGGCCFVISGFLFTIETQPKWYIPAPKVLGWHIGFWNFIGGIGFTVSIILQENPPASSLPQSFSSIVVVHG